MGNYKSDGMLSVSELRHFALIMAYIVDQKSPFTAKHSEKVGTLARHIAELFGLFKEQCTKIEIAGFLHDIGKLRMPDEILEKPGALTDIDRAIMNQHSYETYEILRHIDGLDDIAYWAAYHHEGLNGSGYPFHPNSKELSVESRILAISDVFQACVQDRPYRDGMPLNEVIDILNKLAKKGKLDKSIVELVQENDQSCFDVAKGYENENNDKKLKHINVLDEFEFKFGNIQS